VTSRQVIMLGTASQAPTRHRHHNSYVVRWDDQLLLFDPGEGTQRQAILAGVAIARLNAVCITHFHGDHCLGLPGVIQRRALDNRSAEREPEPLPVFFPAEGEPYFERLRTASIFHDVSGVEPHPVNGDGVVGELGPAVRLSAAYLTHRVATVGYRIDEPDGVSLDPDRLAARGLAGPDVGRLVSQGWLDTPAGRVTMGDVSRPRPGQSLAVVMDTAPCQAAEELARGVDLLVCESTFLHRHVDLAQRYRHLTALQAATLASRAGARRLVLTHFSARYDDPGAFAREALAEHDDVVVAEDLLTVDVPARLTS
jgi:ribonuclease Z